MIVNIPSQQHSREAMLTGRAAGRVMIGSRPDRLPV